MLHSIEDTAKRRLTERLDIQAAMNIMKSRGYQIEEIIGEITKIFYVDLDEFNHVLMSYDVIETDQAA